MKTNYGTLYFAYLVSVTMWTLSWGAETSVPSSTVEAQDSAPSILFRGYFALAESKEFVSIARVGEISRWVPVGGNFEDYRVGKIDREAGVVVLLDANGAEHRLTLETAVISASAATVEPDARVRLPQLATVGQGKGPAESEIVDVFPPAGTIPSSEGLDWDWINSEENPMRKMATLPSISETKNWSKLTAVERAALVELYRQCGWAISVFIKANGRVGAQYRKIEQPGVAPGPRPKQTSQPLNSLPRN